MRLRSRSGLGRAAVAPATPDATGPSIKKPLALFDAWTSKEAFICGTGAEVVPVLSVDDRIIGAGGIGPVKTAKVGFV